MDIIVFRALNRVGYTEGGQRIPVALAVINEETIPCSDELDATSVYIDRLQSKDHGPLYFTVHVELPLPRASSLIHFFLTRSQVLSLFTNLLPRRLPQNPHYPLNPTQKHKMAKTRATPLHYIKPPTLLATLLKHRFLRRNRQSSIALTEHIRAGNMAPSCIRCFGPENADALSLQEGDLARRFDGGKVVEEEVLGC